MLSDSITLKEGGEIVNLTNPSGTAFPLSANDGEVFFRTDAPNVGLYIYKSGSWEKLAENNEVSDLAHTHDSLYVKLSGNSSVSGNISVTTGYRISVADAPVNPNDLVNKSYVDSVASGLKWNNPLVSPNLVRDDLNDQGGLTVADYESYVVGPAPTGAFSIFAPGDVVYHNGTSWTKIKSLQIGDRFGLLMEPLSYPVTNNLAGSFTPTTDLGKIVECVDATPGAYVWNTFVPTEGEAVFVNEQNSFHFGHAYTFDGVQGVGTYGTTFKWIEFAGPAVIQAGQHLSYTGNVLNVVDGPGSGLDADTWNGAGKYTSTSGPSGGSDGDLWFKYIP